MTLARWFALLALLLGARSVFVMPPMQVPDESAHFFRAYTVSTGHCLSPPTIQIPAALYAIQIAYPPWVEQVRPVQPGEYRFLKYGGPVDEARTVPIDNSAANLYSCVPYLPAATALRFSLLIRRSAIFCFFAVRLANLAVYIAVIYLAITILPEFGLLLFVLACMPMALQQAGSASADAVGISVSFLWCAYVVHLMLRGQNLTRAEMARVVGLAGLLCLCKFNVWLVLLAVLLPGRSWRQRLALAGACLGVACATAGLWQFVDKENVQAVSRIREPRQIFMQQNAAFLAAHPALFLRVVWNTFTLQGEELAGSFIGLLGWRSIALPDWLDQLYYVLLGVVAVVGVERLAPWRRWHRAFLVFLFAASLFSLFWLMYILEATKDYTEAAALQQPEWAFIPNVQGRYLIYFALPLLFALAWKPLEQQYRRMLPVIAGLLVIGASLIAQQTARDFYATPHSPAHKPQGSIDLVQPGAQPGQVHVHGWAACADGLKEVQVYVDGHFADNAFLHLVREDVGGMLASIPEAYESGWVRLVDLNRFPPGPHRITAIAVGKRDTRQELFVQAAAQHNN